MGGRLGTLLAEGNHARVGAAGEPPGCCAIPPANALNSDPDPHILAGLLLEMKSPSQDHPIRGLAGLNTLASGRLAAIWQGNGTRQGCQVIAVALAARQSAGFHRGEDAEGR
jgi:hypothetical protein